MLGIAVTPGDDVREQEEQFVDPVSREGTYFYRAPVFQRMDGFFAGVLNCGSAYDPGPEQPPPPGLLTLGPGRMAVAVPLDEERQEQPEGVSAQHEEVPA